MSEKEKIFNDPIHGTIALDPFLVKIIDTPEFQRLRHIKQLGGAYYVYPEAQHNRFEHSIGTCHLAGKLVEHLRQKESDITPQPTSRITKQDVLCVKVAGLCHDLGHGPFSHLFDGKFLPRQGDKNWKHEQGSCKIFDRIIERIDPLKPLSDHDRKESVLSKEDRIFITEMIAGKEMKGHWTHKGRGVKKSFLYEIISNKTSGVDVDKWDYFARDCYHLGITYGFDHNRLIHCTRVLTADVEEQPSRRRICYRDKEVYNLYEMFHARFSLHKRACQHTKVNAVELMLTDVLCAANPFILISDGNGKKCTMSDCVKYESTGQYRYLDAYCKLDDRILKRIEDSCESQLEQVRNILEGLDDGYRYQCIGNKVYKEVDQDKILELVKEISENIEKKPDEQRIEDSSESKLEHAGNILKRLAEGDRYRCIGNKVYKKVDQDKKLELEKEISKNIEKRLDVKFHSNIRALIVKFDYGKGHENPIDYCRFYSKEDPEKSKKISKDDVSALLPSRFQEYWVQGFCTKEKVSPKERESAARAFNKWYEDEFPEPSNTTAGNTGVEELKRK